MNLQQLEYIEAVDRFKSFSKAAEFCHVTQATLSTMIKKLEEELGVVLFDRKRTPVVTTETGKQILREAHVITEHARLLKTAAVSGKTEVSGTIRMGIIPTVASSLLPIITKPLLEAYPKLTLEIIEHPTQVLLEKLQEGKIDLGILSTPVHAADVVEELLYHEALLVYGSIKGTKKYLIPEEVRKHKIWLLEEGHCLRDQFVRLCALRKKEIQPGNLKFQANSLDTLLNMVDAFGGITLIPELYYKALPRQKKGNIRYFSKPFPVREISMIYPTPYARKHVMKAISTLIRKRVENELMTAHYEIAETTVVDL